MTSQTPVSSISYADLTDSPNANTSTENLALSIDHLVIPKYATTAARDAANTAPVSGDMCYTSDTQSFWIYGTSAWRTFGGNQAPLSWTPTWSTSTGLHIPSLGNGSFVCFYTQVGCLVFFRFKQIMGSTTSFNSGTSSDNWTWTLPVPPADTANYQPIGNGRVVTGTASTGPTPILFTIPGTGSAVISCDTAGGDTNDSVSLSSGFIDAASPFAWTTTGTIYGSGFYWAAQ